MEAIMEKSRTQNVPTPMDDDLLEKLDIMRGNVEQTRAGFIRLLVRQAWESEREHDGGLELLLKKARNGKKQIKQLRAQS